MSLYHYLVRLETTLHSRQEIAVELLQFEIITIGVQFRSAEIDAIIYPDEEPK